VRACHGARWKQRRHVCRENVLWAGKRSVGGVAHQTIRSRSTQPLQCPANKQTAGQCRLWWWTEMRIVWYAARAPPHLRSKL
jgi:hypothetical protein